MSFKVMNWICFLLIVVQFRTIVAYKKIHPRIIGGNNVEPGEIPYQVSIRVNGEHHCGGAVLNENSVITAAHCFSRKASRTVYAGSINRIENGTEHIVTQVHTHEKYDHQKRVNDIAIISISPPFKYHFNLKPVELPFKNYEFPDNTNALISGWGLLADFTTKKPLILKKALVTSVNDIKCGRQYQKTIFDSQICAQGFPDEFSGPRDACQGDSGGPLIYNRTLLVGIVSWGRGCGENYPGVYTKVSYFIDWIKDYLS